MTSGAVEANTVERKANSDEPKEQNRGNFSGELEGKMSQRVV